MFCTRCGEEVVDKDGKYCSKCGLFITNESEQSGKTPSIGFKEFFKRKEENRREHFKPSSKKPKKSKEVKETEVSINIGVKKYNTGNAVLKTSRGRTLPIRVSPTAGSSAILEKAVKKHEDHNNNMMKGQHHVLLYPDNTEVINVPGSNKPFVLKDYRDEVGKSFSRLTLYIAVHSDFMFTEMNSNLNYSSSDDNQSADEETASSSKISKSDIKEQDLLRSVFAQSASNSPCTQGTATSTSTSSQGMKSNDPEVIEVCKDQGKEKCEVIEAHKDQGKNKCAQQSLAECPTCFESFHLSEIGIHADNCADIWIGDVGSSHSCSSDEIETSNAFKATTEIATDLNTNIKSIISDLASKCLTPEAVRVNIRRKNLWADFKETKRKRNVTPNDRIRVVFLGEPSVDDGGPKREFFSGNVV